jgi:hypothetical protein
MKYIYEISPGRGENYYEVYFARCHDETLVPTGQKILAILYTEEDLMHYTKGLSKNGEIFQYIPASASRVGVTEPEKSYPFSEGDDYWTIEKDDHDYYSVVESTWDAESELLHDENPTRELYATARAAMLAQDRLNRGA